MPMIASIKLYSFFDPRVFSSLCKICQGLGKNTFIASGIDSEVWGMESGYIGENGFTSFLFDRSKAWQEYFEQYLLTGTGEGKRISNRGPNQGFKSDPKRDGDEQDCMDFQQLIRSTYFEEAAKSLRANWEGFVRVGFLGANPANFFGRLEVNPSPHSLLQDVFKTLSARALPSSALLPGKIKRGVLGRALREQVVQGAVGDFQKSCGPEWDSRLSPLKFFETYQHRISPVLSQSWRSLSLLDYLQTKYRWTCTERPEREIPCEVESEISCIHFFQGCALDRPLLGKMLKLFINGQHVILNREGISQECRQRLEAFWLENDIPLDKTKLYTDLLHGQLGDAKMIVFDGANLSLLSQEKKFDFWHRVISTFKIVHLSIPNISGLEGHWRSRLPTPSELNYEEIRRLAVYNTSSGKQTLSFSIPTNFKLLRVVDSVDVRLSNGPANMVIEFASEGTLSLDFGVFS